MPPESLTEKYNRHAKIRKTGKATPLPPSLKLIEQHKKKLSRPTPSPAPSPLGRLPGSYSPKNDRQIRAEIKAIQDLLAKRQRETKQAFAKAAIKGKAKRSFNRSVRPRM